MHPEKHKDDLLEISDDAVVLNDMYPKAQKHVLVLAQTVGLDCLADVQKEHLQLLNKMHDVSLKWAEKFLNENAALVFHLGYHMEPSMRQLHLHVISQDFQSTHLKNKKHWNSFNTAFFHDSVDVMDEISSDGKATLKDDDKLLSMELRCPDGTKIGATLWQELFPEFEPKLHCGGAYVIQNVKVVDTHSYYKVSAIKYLVYFVKTTSVKEVDRPEIPPNVHAITSFAIIISGSSDEIKVFPACVDQLLGKTWVVRFKHRIQMHQSSMLDFSEQEHHIQSVISTLGLQDEQCLSNKSAAVGAASSSQQDYHPTPSLSQSSEYDPGNAAFVTPAKRTSDQQGSSQFDSDDFTTYELSTNKHIKVE
ncbi:hypothetical protein JHK86_006400 [Glycine max]|nr:hypothetical protein JHK86_006400 [Glycine max]